MKTTDLKQLMTEIDDVREQAAAARGVERIALIAAQNATFHRQRLDRLHAAMEEFLAARKSMDLAAQSLSASGASSLDEISAALDKQIEAHERAIANDGEIVVTKQQMEPLCAE